VADARARVRLAATVSALGLLAVSPRAFPQAAPPAAPRPAGAGVAIGELAWADGTLERAELPLKSTWRRLVPGDKLRTGDTFRTDAEGTVRLDFPWMTVGLSPSTMLTIPASTVLSTVLEQGRAEFAGPGRDIVKIRVGDGEVRGGGRLVLRRMVGLTSVSVLEGSFRVRASGRTVEIRAGHGTAVPDGAPPPPPSPLPEAPRGLRPGSDPFYVRSGQAAELTWTASGPSHHVEILALQGDGVLLARDASSPPLRLEIPWLGTYRWRVAARNARGIESRPSSEGVICAVDR
jgi:hypothetical protein